MPLFNPPAPLADVAPVSEAGAAAPGAMPMASRADHTHKRRATGYLGTLNVSGEASITFANPLTAKPAVNLEYIEAADGQPVILKVKSWTMAGADYAGIVIKGYRSRPIPQNLVSLLLGAVYDIFQTGTSVQNVEFSAIILEASA